MSDPGVGAYLKRVRQTIGLSLRTAAAQASITNGYLSQIEGGGIKRPSTQVLHDLSEAYGLDYRDLLLRAGHPVPRDPEVAERRPPRAALNGVPATALDDLDEGEVAQLMDYLAYLRSKRAPAR